MSKGTIKWFNPDQGFGFIMPDEGGRDLYFQANQIETPDKTVHDGQRVSYEYSLGRKGPEAIHIQLLQ